MFGIDLHAYDDQDRHVGLNYETGEYEIQIPGAQASGDLIRDLEWIYVPDSVRGRYVVDNHDLDQWLDENPEYKTDILGFEYNFIQVSYDGAGSKTAGFPTFHRLHVGKVNKHP